MKHVHCLNKSVKFDFFKTVECVERDLLITLSAHQLMAVQRICLLSVCTRGYWGREEKEAKNAKKIDANIIEGADILGAPEGLGVAWSS